jgi:hypothetical protein
VALHAAARLGPLTSLASSRRNANQLYKGRAAMKASQRSLTKRRLTDAGLLELFSPHSFRVPASRLQFSPRSPPSGTPGRLCLEVVHVNPERVARENLTMQSGNKIET